MRRWNRSQVEHERPVTDAQWLVSESEAFLCGHLAELMLRSWQHVPSWAWVNSLAHGTRQDIAQLEDGRWGPSLKFLAEEILSVAEDDETLGELQHAALIPLELHMLASTDGAGPGARHLVHGVLGAIRSFRQSTQR